MKYTDITYLEIAAFENALDCLYYGYGKKYWNNCGLDKETSDKIWKKAIETLEKQY